MSTIDSQSIIDELINNNGIYPGDPQIHSIVEYVNAYGNVTWGVTWPHESNPDRYTVASEFIIEPSVIWHKDWSDEIKQVAIMNWRAHYSV